MSQTQSRSQVAHPAHSVDRLSQLHSDDKLPTIVADVTPKIEADSVDTGGRAQGANNWARAAFAIAVLSLLVSWIPPISIVAIGGVSLALLGTIVGFVISFWRRGSGRLLSIAAGCISAGAIVLIVVTTSAYRATQEMAASAQALSDQLQAHPIQIHFPEFAQPESAAKQFASTTSTKDATASLALTPPTEPTKPTTSPVPTERSKPLKGIAAAAKPTKKDSESAARKRFSIVLRHGRHLAAGGNIRTAERTFRRIIDGAPGTAIAAEAQKELDALPPY